MTFSVQRAGSHLSGSIRPHRFYVTGNSIKLISGN